MALFKCGARGRVAMGVRYFFSRHRHLHGCYLWPVAPRTLTFGAVCDLSCVVEEAELHPANPLSALRTCQLPATETNES